MVFAGADDALDQVLFTTSQRLVPQDVDSAVDLYERSGGVTRIVSIGPSGGNANIGVVFDAVSASGDRVVFETDERLTPDDTDAYRDVYYRENGALQRASSGEGPGNPAFNGNGNHDAFFVGFDRGSGRIAIESNEALRTSDEDTTVDVYVRANSTVRVSVPPTQNAQGTGNGAQPAHFDDFGQGGFRVFWHSDEQLSTADDDLGRDIYMWDDGDDDEFVSDSDGADTDDDVTWAGVGEGGDLPVWETAEQAVDATDDDDDVDAYSRDLSAGVTMNESAAFTAAGVDVTAVAPTSGRIFAESAEQVDGDTDAFADVFGLQNGVATRLSLSNGTFPATFAGADEDGSNMVWSTIEQVPGKGDTDSALDLYETEAGVSALASAGPTGGFGAFFRGYAEDGSRILFTSQGNFGADVDGATDVFARAGGTTTRVTPGSGPVAVTFGAASADATGIAYTTPETLTALGDGDGESDVFKTLAGGITTLETPDVTPPDTLITSGPSGLTRFNPPGFGYTSNEPGATFACRVDGGPYVACGSRNEMGQGAHVMQIRATDRAGNADPTPAARSFEIDSVGPKLGISRRARRADRRGRFKLTVSCPAAEHGGCAGSVSLKSRIRLRGRSRTITFAARSFRLRSGQRAALALKVSARNLRVLRRIRRATVAVNANARDGLGNLGYSVAKVALRAPRSNR